MAAYRRVDALAADVGTAALVPRDEAALLELVEREAERCSADVEQFAQLALGREAGARGPFAGTDPALCATCDDGVQRFSQAMAPRIGGG